MSALKLNSIIFDHDFPEHLNEAAVITMVQAGIWPVSIIKGWNEKHHEISYSNSGRGFEKEKQFTGYSKDYEKVKPFFLAWATKDDRGCEYDAYHTMLESGQLDLDEGRQVTEDLFFKWLDAYDIGKRSESMQEGEKVIAGHLKNGLKPRQVLELLLRNRNEIDLSRHSTKRGLLAKIYRTQRKIEKGSLVI